MSMMQMMLGAGGGGGGLDIDDVFSLHLYTGTGAGMTITNGINLSGEGGLVWIKDRDDTYYHVMCDTERGATKLIYSNSDMGTDVATSTVTAFNTDGFTIGNGNEVTNLNDKFVSWTFRKAPGFFDIVEYTGDGESSQQIPHSLGSTPGCIMVKCTSTGSTNWRVYHRSLGATKAMFLDLVNEASTSVGHWNDTAPTSTHFTVGVSNDVNADTDTYIAYIFAHDDQQFGADADQSIIKCGSYTASYSMSVPGPSIDLGWEPQYVMIKKYGPGTASASNAWGVCDEDRLGTYLTFSSPEPLYANTTAAEEGNNTVVEFDSDGFNVDPLGQGKGLVNYPSGGTHLYIAIRKPD